MKKFILCVVMVLCAAIFVGCVSACGQTTVVAMSLRWEKGEVLTYDVSYAATEGLYPVSEIAGALLTPTNCSGTYVTEVLDVVNQDSVTTLKTTLDVWNTYPAEKIGDVSALNIPSDFIQIGDTEVKTRTVIETTVVFPLYKCTSVSISAKETIVVVEGKDAYRAEYNDYTATCDSYGESAVYSIKHNNKTYPDVTDASISLKKIPEYVDNAALMFSIRALNTESLTTAQSKAFTVVDIISNTTRSVTVSVVTAPDVLVKLIGEGNVEELYPIRIATGNTYAGVYNYAYLDTSGTIETNPDNYIEGAAYDVCKNRVVYLKHGYMLLSLVNE